MAYRNSEFMIEERRFFMNNKSRILYGERFCDRVQVDISSREEDYSY